MITADRELLENQDEHIDYGTQPDKPGREEDGEVELDELYATLGFGPAQYLYFSLLVLMGCSERAEVTVFSLLMPTLNCQWELSAVFQSGISITLFGCYGIAAIMTGRLADRHGRKGVLRWSFLLLVFGAFVGTVSPNKWVFLVSRLLTGAAAGVNINCMMSYSSEFAESKWRSYGILMFGIGAGASNILVNLVAYLFIELVGWRWIIAIVSIPTVPAYILLLILPESPRFLVVSGRQEEAEAALRWMAKLNSVSLPQTLRIKVYQGQEQGSIRTLFSPEHVRTTSALCFISFATTFIDLGTTLFFPLLFSRGHCSNTEIEESDPTSSSCAPLKQQELGELTFTALGMAGGAIFALLLANTIGRNYPYRTFFGLVIAGLSLLFFCTSHDFTLYATLAIRVVTGALLTLMALSMQELFPTRIRSTAVGVATCCGKIGSVIATGMVYALYDESYETLAGCFVAAGCLGLVGTLILNVEGMNLDIRDI